MSRITEEKKITSSEDLVKENYWATKKCREILNIDPSIRFAGICSSKGNLIASEYKIGVNPLFSDEDLEFSSTQSCIRAFERNILGVKLGRMFYSVTAYENVKRATFSLDNESFLLVSFETRGNEHEIIKKVIYVVGLN